MKTDINNQENNLLSTQDLDILKLVRDGKTNNEIGEILGKSKYAIQYCMKNIMKKLNVTSRTHAVTQAIGQGFITALGPVNEKKQSGINIGIVGCGNGGTAILDILKDNPLIHIVGIAEINPKAIGVEVAEKLNIPIVKDYHDLLEKGLNVIVNLTGSESVEDDIRRTKPTCTELMGALSAMLMWQLADERRKRYAEKEKVLREHETLYHLGTLIENIDSMNDAGYALVDYATKLLNMPAGSMAIFDDKSEDMKLVASKGFSDNFTREKKMGHKKGGIKLAKFSIKRLLILNLI